MNILFLEQYSKISGGQLCLLDIIGQLDRSKYTSYVVVPEPGELTSRLSEQGIESFVFPVGSYTQGKKTFVDVIRMMARSLLLIPRIYRVIKKHRIDLVYANAPRALLWGTIAAKWAGVPILWHMHLIMVGAKEKLLTRLLLKLGVDHVICVSRAVADSFITGTSRPKELSVIYNGTDLVKFSPVNSGEIFRAEFGLEPDQPAVGIIGQISAAKGHETFIRAAKEIAGRFPAVRFFVVGGSSYSADGEEFVRSIQALVHELGMDKNVVFTGPRADIPQVIAGMDVVILPSLVAEACPRALLETLAAGRVIVATDNGAAPELITHGEDGFLFSPGEAGQLADIVINLLDDTELRAEINKNARNKAQRSFRLEDYTGKIIDILNRLSDR